MVDWKNITGYENSYQISSEGEVKSLKRKGCKKDKILKSSLDGSGYLNVNLSLKGKTKSFHIHKLVAQEFLNHKAGGYDFIIDHKDNNKLNNKQSNLQIITVRKNTSKDQNKRDSKFVGVSWNKRREKWMASIRIKGKLKYLGYFENELNASKAYQDELEKL